MAPAPMVWQAGTGSSATIAKFCSTDSGVCVLCSRGCGFVSKRDRRGYFRFVPMQLAEGRPLAVQLGINPDRPDSFAFVANGQASVKSEAVLRIARELPRW